MRSRLPAHSFEITGHCERCRDIFDLVVEQRGGVSYLPSTPTAVQEDDRVIHKPTQCGGTVRLFGRPMRLANLGPRRRRN